MVLQIVLFILKTLIRLAYLTSDLGKKLTNGDKITDVIQIPEEELDQWYEIDDPNGQL